MKELNLKNHNSFSFLRYKKILISLFLGFLSASIVSCADDVETEEELIVIDSAYVTISTPSLVTTSMAPPVPYPIQIKDEIKIKVGEVFNTYEDFDWYSVFSSNFSITNPEIIEGEGTVCVITENFLEVLGKAPGYCFLKFPSSNAGIEGFIFQTIAVIEG